MRVVAGVCALAGLLLGAALPSPAGAQQDAEALRRQVEQMRRDLEALTQRLQELESRPAPAAAGPGTVTVSQASPGAADSGPPTLAELARPREPFALATRRGPGQFLFDIGVAGDFIANLTQRSVDKANAGTFAGRENRVFPREVELALFGQVDPYARAEVRFEAAEEFEDGERELHVGLSEAHLMLLTLPFGTQLKLGQMRNRFGLLNQLHQHALPQPDRPNVLVRFFGEEQLVERGAELTWVPPLPVHLEFLVGLFNGDNEEAFGRGSLKAPLLTGRLRTFLELGRFGALQLGASAASGETPERRRNTLWGLDAKYKLTPGGWRHPLLTLGGEVLFQDRRVNVEGEDLDEDGVKDTPDETRIRERLGWYAWGEVQPWRRWAAGFRYDWTQFPVMRGREWAVQPYVAFMPSEFLRFRLAYKHTSRDKRDGFHEHEASGRTADELILQATFILGAHPAHPF